jgi:hypothetical protein
MVSPIFFVNAPERKPLTECFCQPVSAMISASVAPFFRRRSSRTAAFLLPSRAPFVSCLICAGFLAAGAFLAVPLAFFATGADCGATLAPSRWIALHTRATALARSVNFLTGFKSSKGATPAKLFHTSTSRAAGQSAVSLASSFSVANVCQSSVAAAARCGR